MIKVSVVIPAYNAQNYMEQCLDTLLQQTLQEVEIIIVDDGSKDDTLSMLREYESRFPQKLKVFHKENGGQASARNLALSHATGEYIGFVDSDDWADVTMFEKMYQKAKLEDADIVICDMVDQFSDNAVYHDHTSVSGKFGYADFVLNKIIRREFAEGLKFPEGLWYEDFAYVAMLLMKTERISVVKEGLYQYNCRDGSTMRNNNAQKNKDMITVLNQIQAYAEENGFAEQYRDELEYLYMEHALYATIVRLAEQDNSEKKEVIEFIRKEVVTRYPLFYKSRYFKEYPLKKRVATFLNGTGFYYIAKFIVDIKKRIKEWI